MTNIVQYSNNCAALVPADGDANSRSRLTIYADWLDWTGGSWHSPDLNAYRDFMLHEYSGRNNRPLSPNSVSTHIASIKGQYKRLLTDNRVRDYLYSMANGSVTERKAFVDEILTRLANSIAAPNGRVDLTVKQDIADSDHIRLTPRQAKQMLSMPDTNTLQGQRDKALLSIMIATGIRESEAVDLDVDDLRVIFAGEVCLQVRCGKGNKQRGIPYGANITNLIPVDDWLHAAQITSGAVFRGFWRGGKAVRPTRLSTRAVNDIVGSYPVIINGAPNRVKPHDLRRTYAYIMYGTGMDILAIRDNLGHTDIRVTQRYIGAQDMGARTPSKSILG